MNQYKRTSTPGILQLPVYGVEMSGEELLPREQQSSAVSPAMPMAVPFEQQSPFANRQNNTPVRIATDGSSAATEKLWVYDPQVLLRPEFIPTPDRSPTQNSNLAVRWIIIATTLMSLFTKKIWPLLIGIVLLIIDVVAVLQFEQMPVAVPVDASTTVQPTHVDSTGSTVPSFGAINAMTGIDAMNAMNAMTGIDAMETPLNYPLPAQTAPNSQSRSIVSDDRRALMEDQPLPFCTQGEVWDNLSHEQKTNEMAHMRRDEFVDRLFYGYDQLRNELQFQRLTNEGEQEPLDARDKFVSYLYGENSLTPHFKDKWSNWQNKFMRK